MGTQAADGQDAVPVPAPRALASQGQKPPEPEPPRWDLRVEPDGRLTAVLTGTNPPLTVTGDDLASLRKQIRTIVMRAML